MGKIIQKRAEQYKKNAIILIVISVLVLIVGGYFAYGKLAQFNDLRKETAMAEELAEKYAFERNNLEGEYAKSRNEYLLQTAERNKKIEAIFPSSEEITEFTRLIDQFFVDNNFANDPVVLNSLVFGSVESDDDFNKLRFTLNVQGTENNFFRFLGFINNSGNLGKPYRIMSVDSINVSFPEYVEETQTTENTEEANTQTKIEELTFTVQGYAYFQK